MTRRTVSRRRFVASTAALSSAMVAAPFVRGAYAAGKLTVGLWDHWVPGANKGAEAAAKAWAEKEKVDLQIDFITSQGNKLILTAAAVVGGVFAIRDHRHSETIARDDAAALQAAKDCVAATHAPDTAAMSASQLKIIECSTGDFGAQATLYSGVLVEAYQAANAKVQVSDMRAAVERHDDDGAVDVLVAVRVKVTNSDSADQEQGYRLRVTMAPDEGKYRIAKLEQVTS